MRKTNKDKLKKRIEKSHIIIDVLLCLRNYGSTTELSKDMLFQDFHEKLNQMSQMSIESLKEMIKTIKYSDTPSFGPYIHGKIMQGFESYNIGINHVFRGIKEETLYEIYNLFGLWQCFQEEVIKELYSKYNSLNVLNIFFTEFLTKLKEHIDKISEIVEININIQEEIRNGAIPTSKFLRERYKLSVKELSEKIIVSESTIRNIECGKSKMSEKVKMKYEAYFGIML